MKNSILSRLRPEAQDFFREKAELRETTTGQVVYEDGAPFVDAVFPESCIISIVAQMADGRSVEKASVGKEGFTGLSAILGGTIAYGRHVVQVPGAARWMSLTDLDVALGRFECVRAAMLLYAKAHTLQLMETVACNSLHTAEQRIVRFLLHAHDRLDSDTFYLTQEAISNLLALRRATVNAVCTSLMQAGAISYNRGTLTIVDRVLLHSRSCECYDRIQRAALAASTAAI